MSTKVFFIGFHKTGTRSISKFLNSNGIPSLHHDFGKLAFSLYERTKIELPPLSQQNNKFTCFLDLESILYRGWEPYKPTFRIEFYKQYKLLHDSYPDAKFVLNTRSFDNWLSSRINHSSGAYIQRYTYLLLKENVISNYSVSDTIEYWHNDWHYHHSKVRQYFTNKNNYFEFCIGVTSEKNLLDFVTNSKNKTTGSSDIMFSQAMPHVH